VSDGLNENGKRVQTYNNNGHNAQKWRIVQNYDGTYRIMPIISSTRALEVKSKSTGNNATIQIYDYSAGNHQKWVFEAKTKPEGVKGVRNTTSNSINCLAYAFFLNNDTFGNNYLTEQDAFYCGSQPVDKALAITKEKMKLWLNATFPGKWREVASYNAALNPTKEWIVCMRVGVGFYSLNAPPYDYHFWYRASDGVWYNKHGSSGGSQPVSGSIVNPSTANSSNGWALGGSYYYKSDTVYYVISI